MREVKLNDLSNWFTAEVNLLPDTAEKTILLLIAKHPDTWIKFPREAILLWPGSSRLPTGFHTYPTYLVKILNELKIPIDRKTNGPAVSAFQFAGGVRTFSNDLTPWPIHHLYFGRFPYPGKDQTLHAVKDGAHFSHSGGLVCIEPFIHKLSHQYGCFAWYLRALAYLKFKYNPDRVFPS